MKLLQNSNPTSKDHILIGEQSLFEGNIISSSSVEILGSFNGDAKCATLITSATSKIKANVKSKLADIAGSFNGEISADKVILRSSVKFNGDIKYKQIVIQEGAIVNGSLSVVANNEGDKSKSSK